MLYGAGENFRNKPVHMMSDQPIITVQHLHLTQDNSATKVWDGLFHKSAEIKYSIDICAITDRYDVTNKKKYNIDIQYKM